MDTVTEQQLKLGYRFEHVRIYYPLQTLNRLLGVEKNASQMEDMLSCFCDAIKDKYGPIRISVKEDRFCFLIPPEGNEYIHSHGTDNGFLEELIHTVSHHGCQLEEILSLFHKYSDHVHIEQTKHGEFD